MYSLNQKNNRILISAIGFITLIIALISIGRIILTGAPDFSVFYDSARNAILSKPIYDNPNLYTAFNYISATLLLVLPFAVLPLQISQALWLIGSFMMFLFSIWASLKLVSNKITPSQFIFCSVVAFFAFPTRFTFGMGQINYYALGILLAGFLVYSRSARLSGIFIGIALLAKPQLIIVLPALLIMRSYRAFLWSSLLLGIGVLISGLLFGWHQYQLYLFDVLPKISVFTGRDVYFNQGLSGLFSRIFPVGLANMATIISTFLLLGVTTYACFHRRDEPMRILSLFLVTLLLIEPLAWQHHFVFLIPAFIYLTFNIKTAVSRLALSIIYMCVAINIQKPDSFMHFPFFGIFLSHVCIGSLLLFFLIIKTERKYSL